MSLKTTFKLYSQTETVFSWSFSKLLFFQCLIVSNASSIRILSDLFRWLYWILWLQNMFLILKWSINAGIVEQLTMRNSIHHQQQSNYSFHVFSLLIQAAAVRPLLSKTNVCFTLNRLQCVLLASKKLQTLAGFTLFWVFSYTERKQGSDISCSSPLFRLQENRINGLWRKEWNI